MGHFLCPQPRGLLLPRSASPLPPCTQSMHATVLGSVCNPVCEQYNCSLIFVFSLFTCFFPRAKQLQPPMGWCSGSGGSLAAPAHSPGSRIPALWQTPVPVTPHQIYSQPQPASLRALCSCSHSYPTEVCWQEGWNQAVVSSGGCNSRVSAETALQGPLCPTEASRASGPLLGCSSCGGLRNRRLWKPPIPHTP